jgi:hypothetical protein
MRFSDYPKDQGVLCEADVALQYLRPDPIDQRVARCARTAGVTVEERG